MGFKTLSDMKFFVTSWSKKLKGKKISLQIFLILNIRSVKFVSEAVKQIYTFRHIIRFMSLGFWGFGVNSACFRIKNYKNGWNNPVNLR